MEISSLYQLYKSNPLVDTDTRKIRKNSIFFALKGENFNGNQFAEKALELGATYAIVDEKKYQTKPNIIIVDNVLNTLQKLANYHRRQLNIPVIALTGSNGKTTTKELINVVLGQKFNTLATKGNLNNHIGVPLTLLSINTKHEIAIIEMGANHQKEIEFLSSICEPDYGYITNFGKAHLEGFGGVQGVIKGKSELYSFLEKNNKTAFVNQKDLIQIEKTKSIKSIYFDYNELELLEVNPFIKFNYKDILVNTNLIGSYNYNNIIAAITIGNYFKVNSEAIKSAIESYIPENNRSQIVKTKDNIIILDAYNANPSSMKVALESFSLLAKNRKAVILGDMFELGNESIIEHKKVIDFAVSLNFEKYYFVGSNFYKTGINENLFKTFEDLKGTLQKHPLKNYSILIKGSRGMQLEQLLDIIN